MKVHVHKELLIRKFQEIAPKAWKLPPLIDQSKNSGIPLLDTTKNLGPTLDHPKKSCKICCVTKVVFCFEFKLKYV